MKHQRLFSLLMLVTAAFTAIVDIESPVPTQPDLHPTNKVISPTTIPTQTILREPTSVEQVEREVENMWNGNKMPIFLEVIQTTIMGEKPAQSPAIGVGPSVYFYSPADKTLSLRTTITVEPETELLIGMVTILQTPNQDYEKREVLQFPSVQPALIQVSALDMETGILHLNYEGKFFI